MRRLEGSRRRFGIAMGNYKFKFYFIAIGWKLSSLVIRVSVLGNVEVVLCHDSQIVVLNFIFYLLAFFRSWGSYCIGM